MPCMHQRELPKTKCVQSLQRTKTWRSSSATISSRCCANQHQICVHVCVCVCLLIAEGFQNGLFKDGDWQCPNPGCGNMNWQRRANCNRCNTARPAEFAPKKSTRDFDERDQGFQKPRYVPSVKSALAMPISERTKQSEQRDRSYFAEKYNQRSEERDTRFAFVCSR